MQNAGGRIAPLAGVLAAVLLAGCASTTSIGTPSPAAPPQAAAPAPLTAQEERYGIRFQSLRMSGSGLLLDFRYQVLDAGKAARVVNRQIRPYVVDKESGHQFQVPHAQKVGTLRHMGAKLQSGRVYSMLFANPGRTIKNGAKVDIVVGDYRLGDVTVE
jgi:hypothetical protein